MLYNDRFLNEHPFIVRFKSINQQKSVFTPNFGLQVYLRGAITCAAVPLAHTAGRNPVRSVFVAFQSLIGNKDLSLEHFARSTNNLIKRPQGDHFRVAFRSS